MKRLLPLAAMVLSTVFVAGCAQGTDTFTSETAGVPAVVLDDDPLRIVAATELRDLETVVEQAAGELGFAIELEFPGGTLENSERLKQGDFDEDVDATWFATNRYVDLIGASGKLGEATKIATSPVALGVSGDHARRLGWVDRQPTWAEIGSAAASGQLTFGMTDPSTSNSGFSALVSVATAYAGTGQALTLGDVDEVAPELRSFLSGQTMTSGSSGWLKDVFLRDPNRANALINYESVLHTINAEDNAGLRVVVPADGVVSADYPLTPLATADAETNQQVEALADWMLDHPEHLTDTFRRPVDPMAILPPELAQAFVIEQPFPGDRAVTDALISAYNNDLRVPGDTTFVLDVSGSMAGTRMELLRSTMLEMISGEASSLTGDVSLRERENVTIIPFNFSPGEPITATVDEVGGPQRQELVDGVTALQAEGGTGIYDALLRAYEQVEPGASIPSIVLMTDGEQTSGLSFGHFQRLYSELPTEKKRIPVFVILYGEANITEMENLAGLTGGKTFDAMNGGLEEAFKEIRPYQ
ncbi:von Willebrand factor type A domain protein [Corynebacterium efficiens YS-314]|nr:substrate-binding domain-containing protein [Corynebacterium efficiens]EEW51330.1 von Willebrand factor type A domain protein [Corynebacterium efficiens YS-314]